MELESCGFFWVDSWIWKFNYNIYYLIEIFLIAAGGKQEDLIAFQLLWKILVVVESRM